MITMRLQPHIEPGGYHTDRFDAVVGGEVVVTSRQPVYDGARRLIEAGHDPDEQIMVIPASGTAWLPQRLGEMAKWTVGEGDKSGLHRRAWQPFRGFGNVDAPESDEP